jgi:hypothetical protein
VIGLDRLISVVGHSDEPYPHIHFAALPTLDADRRLRISEVHPGHRAEQQCRDAGGTRRQQKQAYQQAMTDFQDRYYEDTVIEFGFARFGPRRQRLDRAAWKAQTKQLRALAAAQGTLANDRQRIVARAARLLTDHIAKAQKKAAIQVAEVKAAAAQRIERTEQHAREQIGGLTTQNAVLNAELKHRGGLVSELTERLSALEAMLAEQGLDLGPGG